ncbi:MAG: YigZ family protein [Bacteroidota bacterium]
MEIQDIYQTLAGPSEGEFKDRGSKFLAYAYPVESKADIEAAQTIVRKLHPKARHYCYAYRLGLDKNNFRANDDGEPSGTAGRPILGQLDSAGVTNVIVIVVRYFGGTLLGASGLINAYRKSAAEALAAGSIVEKIVEEKYTLYFDYGHMSKIMNVISKPPFRMLEQRFTETAELDVAIRRTLIDDALLQLKAQVAEVYLEEVPELKTIAGFEIKYCGTL